MVQIARPHWCVAGLVAAVGLGCGSDTKANSAAPDPLQTCVWSLDQDDIKTALFGPNDDQTVFESDAGLIDARTMSLYISNIPLVPATYNAHWYVDTDISFSAGAGFVPEWEMYVMRGSDAVNRIDSGERFYDVVTAKQKVQYRLAWSGGGNSTPLYRAVRSRVTYADTNALLMEKDDRVSVLDPTSGSKLVFARAVDPLPRDYPHTKTGDALTAFALIEEWAVDGLVRRITRDDAGRAVSLQDRYGNVTSLRYGTDTIDLAAAPGAQPASVLSAMVDPDGNAIRFSYRAAPPASPGRAPLVLLTSVRADDGPVNVTLDYDASGLRRVWKNGDLWHEYVHGAGGQIRRIVNGDRTGLNFDCYALTEKLTSDFRLRRPDVSRIPLRRNQLNIQPFSLPTDGPEQALPRTNVVIDPTTGDVRGITDRATGRMEEYLYSDAPLTFGGARRIVQFHERRATLRYGAGPKYADSLVTRRGDYDDGDATLAAHDAQTPHPSCGKDAGPLYPLASTRVVTVLEGVKVVAGANDFAAALPAAAVQGSYVKTEYWYTRAGNACAIRIDEPSSVPNAGRHQDTTLSVFRDALLPSDRGFSTTWPSGDMLLAQGTNEIAEKSFCYDTKNRVVAVGGGYTLLGDGACDKPPSDLLETMQYKDRAAGTPGASDGAIDQVVESERIAVGERRTTTTSFDVRGRIVARADNEGDFARYAYTAKGVTVTTPEGTATLSVDGPLATQVANGRKETTRSRVASNGAVTGTSIDTIAADGVPLSHDDMTVSADGTSDVEEDVQESASGNMPVFREDAP